MANPLKGFTIQNILRRTSPEVLQQYLDATGLTIILQLAPLPDFRAQHKNQDEYVNAIEEQIRILSKPDLATLMKGFLRVYMLTRNKGRVMTAFLHRSHLQGTSQTAFLDDYDKLYDRAFLLLLRLPEQVEEYYLVYMSEHQNSRYWNDRRDYVPEAAEALTEADVQQLKEEVKTRLRQERRGNHCQERFFDFDGKTYIFLFADDQPIVDRAFDEKSGSIDDLHYIPVFQIAIAYDRQRGMVSICCENATTRLNMHRAVAKAKFGEEEIPDYPEDDAVYDLEHTLECLLQRQRIDLDLSAGKDVEDIFIKAMRLRVSNLGGLEILLDTKTKNREKQSMQPDAMYVATGSVFKVDRASSNAIFIRDAKPTWIEWVACYRDPYNEKIILHESFTMSGKNTCNLDFDGVHGEIRACLEHNSIIRRKAAQAGTDASQVAELAAFS